MLDAAIKALTQMFSPPFRSVLWKSIGLALLLIVLLASPAPGADLARDRAGELGRGALGPTATRRFWVLAKDRVGLGGARHRGGFGVPNAGRPPRWWRASFADDIALEVERSHYPADPPGTALPFGVR